jgi:hypothetical protein
MEGVGESSGSESIYDSDVGRGATAGVEGVLIAGACFEDLPKFSVTTHSQGSRMAQMSVEVIQLAGDVEYRVNEAILYKLRTHYEKDLRRARSHEEREEILERLEELAEDVHEYLMDSIRRWSSI